MINLPKDSRTEKPDTRSKMLGGSNCLNYYTWVRGSAATFEDWEAWRIEMELGGIQRVAR